jgi:23S rRNA (cytosine1962-C5)-methyltransferase
MLLIAKDWQDYELIDAGDEQKLERWGKFILRRPDPQAFWSIDTNKSPLWDKPDMLYQRESTGGGQWENYKEVPETWIIKYKQLKFNVKPTGFKHTALFPEQAVNWDWMMDLILSSQRKIKVLNLFGYTGGASVACAVAGASEVVHVDSSRGINEIAKENAELSGQQNGVIRFLTDDAVAFVKREIRRGNNYDAIIMDPPPFGRGASGQVWKIEQDLPNLIELCTKILSAQPLFFLVNTYAVSIAQQSLLNLLELNINHTFGGNSYTGELALPITAKKLLLGCGIYARWQA